MDEGATSIDDIPGTAEPVAPPNEPPASTPRVARLLILGDRGPLADVLVKRLVEVGGSAHAPSSRTDSAAKTLLLEGDWTAVVVITHDDALALRLTLLSAHLRPDLPLWATLFDRTIVGQLHSIVSSVGILSPADLAADALLKCCLESGAAPMAGWRRGVRVVDDALRLLAVAGVGLAAADDAPRSPVRPAARSRGHDRPRSGRVSARAGAGGAIGTRAGGGA
jgi:hypothetical protein